MVAPKLVYFDLEGTGLDTSRDRIVEISMYGPGGRALLNTLVNPGIPIPPDSTAIHGISDADVQDMPPFRAITPQVERVIEGATLVGYSSMRYDVPLLDAELRRAGRAGLPRDEEGLICIPEIDLYNVWSNAEPRTLVGAAKRFAGVDLEDDAHRAEADTKVLAEVMRGMAADFDEIPLPGVDVDARTVDWSAVFAELRRLSRPEWMVDRDGKFRREDDGTIVFGFSQKRGQPVTSDPGLLEWMLGKDFSSETLAYARRFLEEIYPSEQAGFL